MNKNAAVSCYPGFVPYPSYRAKQMQKSHRRNVDDVSNTQRFNTYADNNPMRFTDPTGYDGFDDVYLGPGMQAWNGIKPEQDGPGGGSGGFNSPINFWVKLSEVNITAYSPVWDNWKNWYRKNNDPYLIWGKNAGANAGGMFGSISVSDTRRYWQNMSMRGGGFGGGGVVATGIQEHDAVTDGLFATGVWANIVKAGFDAANSIQPEVSIWAIGSRIFGRGTLILSGISIGYDFATGTANTSTMVNLGVTVVTYGVIGIVGAAAIPYVVGAGIIYGVWSIAGGDKWLNNTWDNSQINIVKP